MVNMLDSTRESGSLATLLKGIELLGLTDLLGCAGEYTAFQLIDSGDGFVSYHIVPGSLTADDLFDLFEAVLPAVSDKPADDNVLQLPFLHQVAA